MSGERLPMRKIREVLRLRLDQGLNSVLIRLTQCEIRQRPERADPNQPTLSRALKSAGVGGWGCRKNRGTTPCIASQDCE